MMKGGGPNRTGSLFVVDQGRHGASAVPEN